MRLLGFGQSESRPWNFCEQARRDPLENPPIKTVCCGTTAVPTHFPPIHFTLTDTSREPNQTREFNLINGEVAVHNPVRFVLCV